MCQRRHTASLAHFLQRSAARKPDHISDLKDQCFLISQWKCCWAFLHLTNCSHSGHICRASCWLITCCQMFYWALIQLWIRFIPFDSLWQDLVGKGKVKFSIVGVFCSARFRCTSAIALCWGMPELLVCASCRGNSWNFLEEKPLLYSTESLLWELRMPGW